MSLKTDTGKSVGRFRLRSFHDCPLYPIRRKNSIVTNEKFLFSNLHPNSKLFGVDGMCFVWSYLLNAPAWIIAYHIKCVTIRPLIERRKTRKEKCTIQYWEIQKKTRGIYKIFHLKCSVSNKLTKYKWCMQYLKLKIINNN